METIRRLPALQPDIGPGDRPPVLMIVGVAAFVFGMMLLRSFLSGEPVLAQSHDQSNVSNVAQRVQVTYSDDANGDLATQDLTEADLHRAELTGADLRKAHLHLASLNWADLSRANLREAKLNGADLREANLRQADFSRANLSEARLYETVFGDTRLTQAKGLDSCVPDGPSTIDHRTLAKS